MSSAGATFSYFKRGRLRAIQRNRNAWKLWWRNALDFFGSDLGFFIFPSNGREISRKQAGSQGADFPANERSSTSGHGSDEASSQKPMLFLTFVLVVLAAFVPGVAERIGDTAKFALTRVETIVRGVEDYIVGTAPAKQPKPAPLSAHTPPSSPNPFPDTARGNYNKGLQLECSGNPVLYPQAYQSYLRSLAEGDAEAACRIGHMIDAGKLGPINRSASLGWYDIARKARTWQGAFKVARAFELGLGVKKTADLACLMYRNVLTKRPHYDPAISGVRRVCGTDGSSNLQRSSLY